MTENISIAPREICSRMHTFLLETSRPAVKDDKDSLVIQTKGKMIIVTVLILTTDDCRSCDHHETPALS